MSGPKYGSNDSDVAWWNRDIMVAIGTWPATNTKLYLTKNLTAAGAATWTDISPVDYLTFERTNLFFGRVKFAPTEENKIYVVGYADGTTAGLLSCWIFMSTNLGLTWNYRLVRDDFNGIASDYTVTFERSVETENWDGAAHTFTMEHERIGDDDNSVNPWAMAYQIVTNDDPGSWDGLDKDATTVEDFTGSSTNAGNLWGAGNWLLGNSGAAGYAYLDDYFGAGGYDVAPGSNLNMPLDAARVNIKAGWTHSSNGHWAYARSWALWNVPQLIISYAFDVARNNTSLYIGFLDAIYQSLDAGYSWAAIDDDGEGAYDIMVDPLIYGAIYYWSAQLSDTHITQDPGQGIATPAMESSSLLLRLAGVKTGSAYMSSWPSNAVNRIQKSFNSGKMWGIACTDGVWKVNLWNLGAVTTQLGDPAVSPVVSLNPSKYVKADSNGSLLFADGISLKYYHQDKLIYVDKSLIYTSDDAGVTMTAKKGGWTTYGKGVVGHRLQAAP
jgi:hypothetical protein